MSIQVFVRSPDTFGERKFDGHLTIGALKVKLESITGISLSSQRLSLYRSQDALEANEPPLAALEKDEETLVQSGVGEWFVIRVEDTNPYAKPEGEYTDVSKVDKFELSQQEYESRPDTVLQNLKARSLGRFAPPASPSSSASVSHTASPDQVVGARCVLLGPGGTDEGDGPEKRGRVAFVGGTEFGEGGEWVGVEMDEPVGKNDGSVGGKTYFKCQEKHGIFVRPERVKVGDYPEVDEFADSEDEI